MSHRWYSRVHLGAFGLASTSLAKILPREGLGEPISLRQPSPTGVVQRYGLFVLMLINFSFIYDYIMISLSDRLTLVRLRALNHKLVDGH